MGDVLMGEVLPRIRTEPLRPLTPETSDGFSVIAFARDVLGKPLLPWQEEAAIRSLELLPDGRYRFRTILILVARQNGKTTLLSVICLWWLYVAKVTLILGVAQDVATARDVWSECIAIAQDNPWLADELGTIRRVNGDEYVMVGRSKYRIAAANRKAARGKPVARLLIDEIREQHNWLAWAALSKTTMAQADGQIYALSNAGDDDSVVLNRLQAVGQAGTDKTFCLLEWSAPVGCALDDRSAWVHANPALGYTIDETSIESALATDPPGIFRTEVLCQRVENIDCAIDMIAWNECGDPRLTFDSLRDRVVVCVDASPDLMHVTMVAAAVMDDGRVAVEVVGAWESPGEAMEHVPELIERIEPIRVAWFSGGPGNSIAPTMRKVEGSIAISGGKTCEACQTYATMIASRRIVQNGDPLLKVHNSGTRRLKVGDSWRFSRTATGSHVDASFAAAGAVHTAMIEPEEEPETPPMIY